MPLGAFRTGFIGTVSFTTEVEVEAEVINRRKVGAIAVGNAQVDTAQYKFGGASALFDGSGDHIDTSENTINLPGDATIECWFRLTSMSNFNILLDHRDATSDDAIAIVVQSSGAGSKAYLYVQGSQQTTTTTSVTTNTWHHIAAVRSGSDWKLYFNGTAEGTTYTNGNDFTTTAGLRVSGNILTNSSPVTGNVDEVRVSDTARYTADFTPQTTPFTNDTNTLLLLHMNGTDGSTYFEDDNGDTAGRSPVGVSAQGNAQVDTAQSKFGGASAYFDGNGDYLKTGTTVIPETGDFTIECWVRLVSNDNVGFISQYASGDSGRTGLYVGNAPDRRPIFRVGTVSIGSTNASSLSTGTWHHLAGTRNGNDIKLWVNGVLEDSGTSSSNVLQNELTVGVLAPSTYWMDGHIDEVRVSDTVRYTSGFTPDTAPFVNDENTLLLLHMNGTDGSTDFRDDNGGRTAIGVSANGDAQIDTAQSKFGGASAYFDGTTDFLRADTAMGSGDFTLDFWWRPTSRVGSYPAMVGSMGASFNANGEWAFYDRHNSGSTKFRFYWREGGSFYFLESTTTVSNGTWYHLAVSRSGSTIKLFVDGTEEDSATTSQSFDTGQDITIGAENTGGTNAANGHIDEFRISNTARYTADFEVQTEPFVNDANTLLLLHMDGTDGDTTFFDDNGVEGENTVTDAPVVLDGVALTASSYYETTSITNSMSSTSREGTFSFWYRDDDSASRSQTQRLFAGRTAIGSGYLAGVSLFVNTSGYVTFYGYDGENNGWVMQQTQSSSPLNDGNWHHILFSYDRVASNSNSAQLYIDGVSTSLTNTRYNDKEDGNDLIATKQVGRYNTTAVTDPFALAQLWYDDTRIDLDESTNRDKFYDSTNSAPVNMGTDGTASGLSQPAIYHYGNTSTFGTNNGRTSGSTYMTYTMSSSGTINDTDTDS